MCEHSPRLRAIQGYSRLQKTTQGNSYKRQTRLFIILHERSHKSDNCTYIPLTLCHKFNDHVHKINPQTNHNHARLLKATQGCSISFKPLKAKTSSSLRNVPISQIDNPTLRPINNPALQGDNEVAGQVFLALWAKRTRILKECKYISKDIYLSFKKC